jgi:hypothetical protein
MQVALLADCVFSRTSLKDFAMYESAGSSTAKTGWPAVFSTLTCSIVGMGVVAAGTFPLLFLLMLLATTSAARTDSLVWTGTVVLGALVAAGWVLVAYGWSHSRVALNSVIILAILWAGFMVCVGWTVSSTVTHGQLLDSQSSTFVLAKGRSTDLTQCG